MDDANPPPSNLFYPKHTTVCTEPFSRFLSEYHANIDHFFFVVKLVSQADENRVIAAKALLPVANDDAERQRLESATKPDIVLNELKKHSTVTSRNLTNGIVNAFQRYFSSIIHSASLKRPALITSSQQVRIDEIMRFTRHRELVAYIIDKKVNELGYGGLAEMEKYFSERLGVQMFSNERERELLRLFVEIRNINVHAGGVVNDVFISRVGTVSGFKWVKDKNFHVDMDSLMPLTDNAMLVALNIDALVAAKFGLKRQTHASWRAAKTKQAKSVK